MKKTFHAIQKRLKAKSEDSLPPSTTTNTTKSASPKPPTHKTTSQHKGRAPKLASKPSSKSSPPKQNRHDQLAALEQQLKIKFKNKKLLVQALTHPSHLAKHEGDNARLEFLGDSVIGLAMSHLLYNLHPKADEGELTKRKGHLVSSKFLAELAQGIHLGKYLYVAHTEKIVSSPTASMLADSFEALIGAFYLDQGYEKAFKLIESFYKPHLKTTQKEEDHNYKGVLQELLQQKYKEQPYYQVVSELGPDHSKTFEVHVFFRGKIFGIGKGKSKKDAEKEAAKEALAILGRE